MVIPRATYRFQFHEKFPLARATELVPYLHALGISHVYASPLFKAQPHSTHGYDTADFNQLNPELGTEADLQQLVETLHAHKMGLVLDVVPNHMGIGGPDNRWWWDILARGPQSEFAHYFDINWESPDPLLRGKVLLPVLGDRYPNVLTRGELKVQTENGAPVLCYFDHRFPLNMASLPKPLEQLNGDAETLNEIIEKQFYRLSWYGLADTEINYRRFFTITSLAGLRIEEEKIFDRVFALTKEWLKRGWLDGLRVDHPDGLRDPAQFLQRLRTMAPEAWIVVEKILEPGEGLPKTWPVAGTTGYDFMNVAGGLFIDQTAEKPLTDFYLMFGGAAANYETMVREKKRHVVRHFLTSEVERLTSLLMTIAMKDWRYRDFSRPEFTDAITEWVAALPVYRTYITNTMDRTDVYWLGRAREDLRGVLVDFISDILMLKRTGVEEVEFVARFQQLSSATMAKGAEDTAFYCYNRFVALNEVGGNPGHFGVSLHEFHKQMFEQQSDWPNTMLGTSTHDTKRSEDVRMRLSLLSEIPQAWGDAMNRWSSMNKQHRKFGWPDRNAEYLYYQTLVGAWPLPMNRAVEYMEKAVHEAKEHTSWNKPNEEYDTALRGFIMATHYNAAFMADLEGFVLPLLEPAAINSLALTLLKLTAPGVPDIYQGSELLELTLVDPDNRRPVDFGMRQSMLAKCVNQSAEEIWKEWQHGLPKLWLTQRILQFRAKHPEIFTGDYQPIRARGKRSEHVVAFSRGGRAITIALRLAMSALGDLKDTLIALPPGEWRNELTGEVYSGNAVQLTALLEKFPVAFLAQEGTS